MNECPSSLAQVTTPAMGCSWDLNPGWLGTGLTRHFLPWTPTSQVPANQKAPWRRKHPGRGPKGEEEVARHGQKEGGRERDISPGSHSVWGTRREPGAQGGGAGCRQGGRDWGQCHHPPRALRGARHAGARPGATSVRCRLWDPCPACDT